MTSHFNYDNIEQGEYQDPGDDHVSAAEKVIDVPADAINASTGTGENLGLFGEIDRALDYRTLTGQMDADSDEWAEPTDETTGLSGAFHATAGQVASANEDINNLSEDALKEITPDWMNWFIENRWITAVAAVGGFAFLYADGLEQTAKAVRG